MYYKLYNECCFTAFTDVEDESVDLLLVDLPYGTTNCKWDSVLPLDKLWKEYNRVCKKNAAMIFTAAQPFTSALIMSNPKNFKYSWVWEKSKATGYLNAKKMPMRAHEDVCVFYRKPPTYNAQMWQSTPYNKGTALRPTDVYGKQTETTVKNDSGLRYPRTVQYFKTAESEGKGKSIHPTQKPVALMSYLIRTYTNPGELVLDNTMGSGTTGVAALNEGRSFVGMEIDEKYFLHAEERMREASLSNENQIKRKC